MELKYIKGIGPKREKLLNRLGIFTVVDLLYHIPRRYEDRREVKKIRDLVPGESNSLTAVVKSVEEYTPRKGLTLIKAALQDETGFAVATWFNQVHLKQRLKPGLRLLITGKVQVRSGCKEILVQDYDILTQDNKDKPGKIIPFYPLIQGLSQQVMRQAVAQVLQGRMKVPEFYSEEFIKKHNLLERQKALEKIHQPESPEDINEATRRLVFDEFFVLQLTLALLRQNYQEELGYEHNAPASLTVKWLNNLPFKLTAAQERVIKEVEEDMSRVRCMNRLIQGDVGSGKTAVAAWAILKSVENGFQSALMAPTEILAQQHYDNFVKWFASLGINVALLKGSMKTKNKEEVLFGIASGEINVVIGTHALIQEKVQFKNLSLLVIDEQHRFGVRQRARLKEKGLAPDVLVMSATPIPRTLALTLYGDLDISVIDQLPPGRKPVKTICILEKARDKLNKLIEQQISMGFQVYVVCPLIEESEVMDLNNAKSLLLKLQETFPGYNVSLLHGKMKAEEKEKIMAAFSSGKVQILVTTTVIEVGVNVPKATIMVIENADRFGLAQLHQLRGRVGRGGDQSYCILVTKTTNQQALQRLKIMTETTDGFRLAEEDMKMRGPGEFFGNQQHGLPEFRFAELTRDQKILEEARQAAIELLKEDPFLENIKNIGLKKIIMQKMADLVRI